MSLLRIEILKLLKKEQRFITKRELCQLLNIKGARRVELKRVLADLKRDGLYGKNKDLAETIDTIVSDVHAVRNMKLLDSSKETNKKPSSSKVSQVPGAPKISIGILQVTSDGCWVESSHRRDSFPPIKCSGAVIEAAEKELERKLSNNDVIYFKRKTQNNIEIIDVIGNLSEPKVFSLMCIQNNNVPFEFSNDAINQAQNATLPPLGMRTDYRSIPLITIDGEDARDFDDAVWAEPDTDEQNKGGWRAIVAIADVAYYVRPGDALDKEAFERGNSIYFADRVVPMLPEGLSNEMCSLKPNEDRACVAVEMVISSTGNLKSYHFARGLMRSAARLTYTQVQEAIDGDYSSVTKTIWNNVLEPLYGCYKSLRKARDQRGSLNLESIERKVIFDESGKIKAIVPKPQQISNQLIEELMIVANVSAARALTNKKWHCLFRIHDRPDETRVDNMKRVVQTMRIKVPKIPKMTPQGFNEILAQETPFKRLIHDLVLRSQAQAIYAPDNLGHFGLGLSHYAHFTSPIRRYADLQVHRALISAFDLGDGGQDILPTSALKLVGEHISQTERTAAQMEREVMDRYLVLHLEDYVGHTFSAIIVGVTGAGIFFALDGSGAQGFLHKSQLPNDYFIFDEENHQYYGKRTKRKFQLGETLTVILDAADSRTSSTTFSLPDSKPVHKKEYGGFKKGEFKRESFKPNNSKASEKENSNSKFSKKKQIPSKAAAISSDAVGVDKDKAKKHYKKSKKTKDTLKKKPNKSEK